MIKNNVSQVSTRVQQRTPVESLFLQANVAAGREDFITANRCFGRAADLDGGKEIWRWKSLGFCPTTFVDTDSIDRYWKRLDAGLDLALDKNIPMDWRTLPTDGFCPSFNLAHLNKSCRDVREKFCKIFEKAFSLPPPTAKSPDQNKGRWRVGFHALHGHEGGFIRDVAGLINALNKKRFDVFVFVPELGMGHCRKHITSEGVTFVPLGGTFERVVSRIRGAECNLIYYRKCGSDTWSYFTPFARCAPVQVTSSGTHGTSGISAVDYFLSSKSIEPTNGQDYYTEKLFLLDAMPMYQDRLAELETPASRDEFGIPSNGAFYFCPHRTAKYHPCFDLILKTIAERNPDSHFVLLTGRDVRGRALLYERLKRNLGETIYNRFIFIPALAFEKYCRLLSLATAILDSPVYAGSLTAFDAFSYNIPEVTLSGSLNVQNFATGIYRYMNLGHLPCNTVDAYIDLAVQLGTEPDFRSSVSQEIEAKRDKIFDMTKVVEEHTRFFEFACAESM
jgi:predicted O-linked N-acetylglucosamine transferase (SPINDLY family)